jgi:hypothetical protein
MDCKIYPLTKEEKEETLKFVMEHEKRGYIERTESPWASPWFFIKKKTGKLRPTQDYRQVNSWTVCDIYPIPRIKQIIERLQGKTLFTALDIRWGYHNIQIVLEDRWKAAFKMPFGLFQPKVMFFSLTNSPATFQHMMD